MPELLVNIDVDDLERAISFYVEGLGLKPGRRLGPQAREMLGASSPICLLANQPGGNVAVALRVAARLGPGQTVVKVAVDSGMKYLSTALYART